MDGRLAAVCTCTSRPSCNRESSGRGKSSTERPSVASFLKIIPDFTLLPSRSRRTWFALGALHAGMAAKPMKSSSL